MPRGGRRAGSGRKPKSLQELQLSGTFRPARHAHLLIASRASPLLTATAPAVAHDVPALPDTLITGLGDAGLRFVDAYWRDFEFTDSGDIALLRLTGRQLDDAECAVSPRERRLASRAFAGLLAQLQ